MPLRTAIGCTSRCSSSSSPAASSWRTTETEPLMPMAPSPGSFFNAVTASTRSPCSCSELRQVNSSCWFDTTILRASPSVLAKCGVLLAGRFPLGPGPGEAVVGLATEQHGVGRAEGGVDGGTHLVVEVREVPLVGRLDDAVERDEQACDDLPHDASPVVVAERSVIHQDDARPTNSSQAVSGSRSGRPGGPASCTSTM